MKAAVRRFRMSDAIETREIFVEAVRVGATERYSDAELRAWVPDPAMPEGWAEWLNRHTTFVAGQQGRLTGFFMIEADGYLNMAFVRPAFRGDGTADLLYDATLGYAHSSGMTRMTALASRYAQGFLRRHGWRLAPDLPPRKGLDPRQGRDDNPINRPMALDLPPAPGK